MNHITPANLGWWLLGMLALFTVANGLINWIDDRWEITPCAPWRYRVTRRWYGTRSQVRLRAEAGDEDAPRYVVLAWDDDDAEVPWLKVHRLNPEFITYWDEDAEPFWGPVTVFAPYAVRRLRPSVTLIGRIPVPSLWEYPLLPCPARVPQDVSGAA